MQSTDRTPEQLLEEIDTLKSRISELERNQISNDDKLWLAILKRLPFTIWACDRNFRIVLWNRVCEDVYLIPASKAVGNDYLELFIDPAELAQSKDDCLAIIDNDETFENFLAYDHANNGARRTMLTNCFRIWDDERKEYLQAEVALEISDLELRKDEHRTLREVGIARLEQQKKALDLQKDQLLNRLSQIYSTKLRMAQREQDRLDDYKEKLIGQNAKPEDVEKMARSNQQKLDIERQTLESKNRDITLRIVRASKSDELDILERAIAALENE